MAKPVAQRSYAGVHAFCATTTAHSVLHRRHKPIVGKTNGRSPRRQGRSTVEKEKESGGTRRETNLLGGFIENTLACKDVSCDTNEEHLEDRLQHHTNKRVSKTQNRVYRPASERTSKVVLRSGPIGVPLFRSAIRGNPRRRAGGRPGDMDGTWRWATRMPSVYVLSLFYASFFSAFALASPAQVAQNQHAQSPLTQDALEGLRSWASEDAIVVR